MNKKIEIIANTSLIVIGLTLGILFYINDNKDLSLILFSIALACILYQFLGGIGQSNSFQLGAVKFGGAAAILIGFMFFLKQFIFTPNDIHISDEEWIPISTETGKLKKVSIQYGNEEIHFPKDLSYKEERKKHEYQLSSVESGKYGVQLKSQPDQSIGFIDINNINTPDLFSRLAIAEDETRMQVFKLHPETNDKNASTKIESVSLPFEIKVFSTSRFSIEPYYNNLEVVKRTSYLVPGNDNEIYVVFLEQANSTDTVLSERYSKWLVKKLVKKLE